MIRMIKFPSIDLLQPQLQPVPFHFSIFQSSPRRVSESVSCLLETMLHLKRHIIDKRHPYQLEDLPAVAADERSDSVRN